MDGANVMAVAAGELRHYLRLACEMDDEGALRKAVRQRFADAANALAPEEQATENNWELRFAAALST